MGAEVTEYAGVGRPNPITGPLTQAGAGSRSLRLGLPPMRQGVSSAWVRSYRVRALGLDLLAGLTVGVCGAWFRFDGYPNATYLALAAITPLVWVLTVAFADGYDHRILGSGTMEYRAIWSAVLWLTAGTAFVSYVTKAQVARGFVLTAIPLILVLSEVCRWVLRHWLGAQRRDGLCFSPTVVVGRVDSVADMVREIQNNPASGLTVVAACVSGLDSGDYLGSSVGGVPVYGGPETALLAVNEYQAEVVAVSSHPDLVGHSLRRLGWALEELGVDLVVSPGIVEVAGPRLTLRPTAGMSLLHVERPLHSGLRAVGKMLLDRVLALSITFFFLPLMVAVAIAIKLENPGPVFFRQTRIGAQGRPFGMVKFRSMVTNAEALLADLAEESDGNGILFKMKDDPRVTKVGKFIRRFSIDELPQLINVVRGEMSLIGPRPPLPSEVAEYESDAVRRLHVRPGMTGLWQVSGRSDLSWEESLRLDLWYVDNWTPILDLQILVRTFKAVLRGSGAY